MADSHDQYPTGDEFEFSKDQLEMIYDTKQPDEDGNAEHPAPTAPVWGSPVQAQVHGPDGIDLNGGGDGMDLDTFIGENFEENFDTAFQRLQDAAPVHPPDSVFGLASGDAEHGLLGTTLGTSEEVITENKASGGQECDAGKPVSPIAHDANSINTARDSKSPKRFTTYAGFYEDSDEDMEEDMLPPQPDHPMDLRPRNFAFLDPSIVDRDESGDYDPNAKTRPSQGALKRRAVTRRRSIESEQPRQAALTETKIRRHGHQYCVVLSISSSSGLRKFKKLAEGHEDNWPNEPVELFEPVDVCNLPFDAYAFRPRGQGEEQVDSFFLRNTMEARGCKHCRALGNEECSMKAPDGQYPCKACYDDNEVCEMVVDPARKQACENCRAQREPCSYVQDLAGDHSKSCDRCEFKGFKCIAGPAYDPLRTRIGDDGKPATPKPLDIQRPKDYTRNYKTCAPCRRGNRWCSLTDTKRGQEPPCSTCRKQGVPCTFEAVPRSMQQRGGTSTGTAVKRRRHSSKLPKEEGDVKMIMTAISHPVTFLASTVTVNRQYACHWCLTDNPLYALRGHGEVREVKMLVWPNGEGYEELEGGHTNEGCEPSRMCYTCTMERVAVIECPQHDLQPLPGFTETVSKDIDARGKPPHNLLMDLLKLANRPSRPNANAIRAQYRRWCSVCPNPAQFECCQSAGAEKARARQSTDHRSLLAMEAQRGCGLRLCWVCAMLLQNTDLFHREFQKFLKGLERSAPKAYYSRGMRADWDFLKKDGALWRQVENMRIRYGGKLPNMDS